MAWIEQLAARTQRTKTYQDDIDPNRSFLAATLEALHYQSVLDSEVYDTPLDCTPVRVDVPALDGWRVTASDWHYALGQPEGKADGWVGFGGRQGAHWFQFRLLRVGYLHWPTRAWDDIGGPPDYDRANLSQETRSVVLEPNQDEIPVESVATWEQVWTTPGGGALDVSWKVRGDQLKELIAINQAGRERIAANQPPETPLAETYFGFVFDLDWSDVPQVVRDGVAQSIDGDWADDGAGVELRDALDRLLGFVPLSEVYVPLADPPEDASHRAPLRKRFYTDGDSHYLCVGVRCDVLNALPSGDLVFDPTIEPQVGASANDGGKWGTAGFSNSEAAMGMGNYDKVRECFYRWTGCTIEGTINTSYIELYAQNTQGASPLMKVAGVDEDNPDAPTSFAEFEADPLTTNQVDWDVSFTASTWEQSPSLNAIFQELVDTYTISNDALMVQVLDDGSSSADNVAWHYDQDSSYGAKLYIDYTAGGGGDALPMAMNEYRMRRV